MGLDVGQLRDCRMVLCLPCGDGERLAMLRHAGIPAVGLDGDAAAVQRCVARGFPAYHGDWPQLAGRRHRFDGALLPDGPPADAASAAFWAALDECLLPGARLLAPPTVAAPPPFERQGAPGEGLWRKPRQPAPAAPGLPVGPCADLFVGCRSVAELAAGSGRFLDALQLREIPAFGFEADETLAATARRRGHDVRTGDLPQLAAAPATVDGLFVGHAIEGWPAAACRSLFAWLPHRLAAGGRCVVRADRRWLQDVLLPAIDHNGWQGVRASAVPHDGRDGFALLLGGGAPATPPPPSMPPLGNRGRPLEQPLRSPFDLDRFERREWSQGGEDGVLAALFLLLGTTNRCCVEFGCGDGLQCNTTALRRRGWRSVLLDGANAPGAPDAVIHKAWITAENIQSLLDQHGVPAEPDLLSIDLDGNDYWVWRAIACRPRVLVAEYNANLPADRALSIPYDPGHRWDGTDYYGASLLALARLGRQKGYTLVHCTQAGVNAIFVRDDLLGGAPPVAVEALYRPPNYWYRGARSTPDLVRRWCEV